jgi:hypothetical protein
VLPGEEEEEEEEEVVVVVVVVVYDTYHVGSFVYPFCDKRQLVKR